MILQKKDQLCHLLVMFYSNWPTIAIDLTENFAVSVALQISQFLGGEYHAL